MAAQSILGRMTQLARLDITAMLDRAEDPRAVLDQMIRDCTSAVNEAETAVAQTVGNLRMMEADAREASKNAGEWGGQATAASNRADQMRVAGDAAAAERFDNLARIAIGKQLTYERDAAHFELIIAEQTAVADRLRTGLMQLHGRLDELNRKRDELASPVPVDALDPIAELSRFEERIQREEARIAGREVSSTVDAQFEPLGGAARDAEVEARLAAMKGQRSRS
jgi:phage shock protein A